MRTAFHLKRLAAAAAFGGFAVTTVIAQTVAPATGPNGRDPAIAPAPEATATSPGTPVGAAVTSTSPGSSGPGYGVVDPARLVAPGADATSPGTPVAPAREALPQQSPPLGSGAAPSGYAPSTATQSSTTSPPAEITPPMSPTLQSVAPGAVLDHEGRDPAHATSPARIRTPASTAPDTPTPVRTP